ncbi:Vegetative incompatibility protein HET-E-1 [Beauveria bassiana]|nr:Vegetative incompatibility protein HET-E-1 [Beauveria bassiana]
MFRWYRDAERCYVYMADVSHASASNEQEIAPWRTPFQNSRWFSRGWTLQELIAPKVVEFYSKEGTFLGDKQSLEYIIRDITGIPTKALRGTPLSEFTATERESWARNRQTKYEEDMAYSLLAIFSVFLPLIYGEGRDEANGDFEKRFKRRREAPEIQNFVARKEELVEMRRTLISDGSRRVVVLHGLGGIGKTQLAVAYLKRYRDEYSAIFWLNIKDETFIRQSFVNVTKQIQQQGADAHLFSELGADDDPNKAVEAAKLWLSLPGNTRWLLVYDNYDAAKLSEAKSGEGIDICNFLPTAYQGARHYHDTVVAHRHGPCNPDAKRLLQELDGLPLALATAGAFPGCSKLRTYLWTKPCEYFHLPC